MKGEGGEVEGTVEEEAGVKEKVNSTISPQPREEVVDVFSVL